MDALGFSTTRWSKVLRASGDDAKEARAALGELCASYRRPLEAFLKFHGYAKTDADAEELTQQFMAVDLVEKDALRRVPQDKVRFRTWLLGALKKRVANEKRKLSASKRGAGAPHLSLSATEDDLALDGLVAEHARSADELFDREWGLVLIARAYERVEAAYRKRGDAKRFTILKDTLPGASAPRDYASAAAELGLTSDAVRQAARRLRQEIGAAVRAEARQTLSTGADIEDELRHLLKLFQGD